MRIRPSAHPHSSNGRPYDRLLANLSRTVELLSDAGEEHWAAWFRQCEREVGSRDAHGLQRILGAYGGMGSFNDLVLCPVNGHQVERGQAGAVNSELERLRSALYSDALALRRSSHG